jgi:hypothetical protein
MLSAKNVTITSGIAVVMALDFGPERTAGFRIAVRTDERLKWGAK